MIEKEELKYKEYKHTITGCMFKAMKWDGTNKTFFKLSDYLKGISYITMYTDSRYGGVLIFWSKSDDMRKYIVALKNDIIVWNEDHYLIYDEEDFLKYYKEYKGVDNMCKKYKLNECLRAFQYNGTKESRNKISEYVEEYSYSCADEEFIVRLSNEFTFVINPGDYCILNDDNIFAVIPEKEFNTKFEEWK